MADNVNDQTAGSDDATDTSYQDRSAVFQDDLETDDSVVDPIMIEHQGEDDDPVRILGMPPNEMKAELNKRVYDKTPKDNTEPDSDSDEGVYQGTPDDLRELEEDSNEDAEPLEGSGR